MVANWDEVKKLAFDFQRAQQASSVQRLSERNCVDIVKKLIEMKLINVIFTNDGKEYLTQDHLIYEIENELYTSGGRISISDLVATLNVDYNHVEACVNQLARKNNEINLVLGQLVSSEYKDNIASEIDLHVQESGFLSISELSKQYDLPTEFLIHLIEERIDSLIKGKLDKVSRTLYTFDYIARYESKIIGVFSAITQPVTLHTIINRYNIPEKICLSTLESLIEKKRILATISGTNFIPEVFSKIQQEYVNNFYKHNRYFEYSTLNKLGISNPQVYLQKKFGDQLCYLQTCAVDQMLCIQIETTIEDTLQANSFSDLIEILPTVLTMNDINMLIKKTLQTNKSFIDSSMIFCDTIVVSKEFLKKIVSYFDEIKKTKGQQDLNSRKLQDFFLQSKILPTKFETDKSQENELAQSGNKKSKKISGGGGGGNTQGREIKTKVVKKKYKSGKADKREQDDESTRPAVLDFLSQEEIQKTLTERLNKDFEQEDISDIFIEAIAEHIVEDLQKSYEAYARELFLAHNNKLEKTQKTFNELQNFVNENYLKVSLFKKAIEIIDTKEFPDFKTKLEKYLLKTLATEIVNELVGFFIKENISENTTVEARVKFINRLDAQFKNDFIKLNNSLNTSVESFLSDLDQCTAKIDLMLKKIDSKKEKIFLSEHQQSLIIQMSECQDPILGFHILVLLVFQLVHNQMLHASGKFVPQIILFLEKNLIEEVHSLMKQCQDLVLKFVSAKEESAKLEAKNNLISLLDSSKQLINDHIGNKKTLIKN